MTPIRRHATFALVGVVASAAMLFTALPAEADTGDILITEENSTGAVLGVADEVVLPGTACDAITVPEGTTQLVIDNLTLGTIAAYSTGDCTGTVLALIDPLQAITVQDTPGENLRNNAVPRAGGHQVGLALELEQ